MLAYEPSGLAAAQTQESSISSMPTTVPNPQGLPGPNPIPVFGNNGQNVNFNAVNAMDFSSMGMEEISAFLSGNGGTTTEIPSAGLSTQAQEALLQNMFPTLPSANNGGTDQSSIGQGQQSETDQMLASLSQSAGLGGDQLGDTDFNFDFSADFGGVDMDFSELVGLFDDDQTGDIAGGLSGDVPEVGKPATTTVVNETSQPVAPVGNQSQASKVVSAIPDATGSFDATQSKEPEGSHHRKRPSIGVGSAPSNSAPTTEAPDEADPAVSTHMDQPPPAQEPTTAAASEPAPAPPDEPMESLDDPDQYDSSNINLDDFNFGEGGMPMVEGDEFESLFAEFK